MLPIIAVFVFFGAMSEEKMVRVRFGLQDLKIKDLLSRNVPHLHADDSVRSAVAHMRDGEFPALPVADAAGILTGLVERNALERAVAAGRGDELLVAVMTAGFRLVDAETPAIQVYYLLRSDKRPLVGVVESGRYCGLVLYDDIARRIP